MLEHQPGQTQDWLTQANWLTQADDGALHGGALNEVAPNEVAPGACGGNRQAATLARVRGTANGCDNDE